MRRLRVEGSESLAELVALYKTETNRHIRQRLQVVMFVKEGRLGTEVAALLNLHVATVRRYVHQYNQNGVEGLRPCFKGGSKRMTKEQEEQFQQRVFAGAQPEDEGNVLHGRDGQRVLENEWGLHYSLRAVYVILHRLRCSSLCPRPRHPKGNPEAQDDFKKGGFAASHPYRTKEASTPQNRNVVSRRNADRAARHVDPSMGRTGNPVMCAEANGI